MQEIEMKINKLLYDVRANVTTGAAALGTLFSGVTDSMHSEAKTIILQNMSANDIYYGYTSAVTTANAGGVIYAKDFLEIPIKNIDISSIFLIASGTSALGITVWG